MQQRTNEWFLARKGMLTASEIYNLLGNHKEPMTDEELAAFKVANPKSRVTTKDVPFSDGSYTYMNKKISERYMPDNDYIEYIEFNQVRNKAVEHGEFWEDEARQRYCEVMGEEVYQVGFIPLTGFENICGGSPDGIVRYREGIIEIKCPFNPWVHQDYLLMEKPEDLKELKLEYYAQMQVNMLVTDSKFGDFVSFDPRTSRSKQLKVLRIPKDEEMCSDLIYRLSLAKKYFLERIEKINNVPTIIR